MKKFEIGKHGETSKFNIWFNLCSKQQIPYITIKNRTKYSSIEWDYINLNPELDKIFIDNSEDNRKDFLTIFKKFANNKSEYTLSNLTFLAEKIPVENAEKFAEELFDITHNQIKYGRK